MNLITYTEAAQRLGVSMPTLYQALEPGRDVFTKGGRRGNNGLLIEEQVRLFMGNNPRTGKKKRLSLDALTPAERESWHQYAREFEETQHVTVQLAPEVQHYIDAMLKRREDEQMQALARQQQVEAARQKYMEALEVTPQGSPLAVALRQGIQELAIAS